MSLLNKNEKTGFNLFLAAILIVFAVFLYIKAAPLNNLQADNSNEQEQIVLTNTLELNSK